MRTLCLDSLDLFALRLVCLVASSGGHHAKQSSRIKRMLRSTIEQLASETDAARQSQLICDYLRASAAFWDSSWHNQMLIWKQKPNATFVGGFNTCVKCGRFVRKGEKGIAILAPMVLQGQAPRGRGSHQRSVANLVQGSVCLRHLANGWDALPELPTKSVGERGHDMLSRLLRFAESRGISVRSSNDEFGDH